MLFRSRKKGVVRVGDAAPDFTLPDQNNSLVRLSQFKGQTWVVLYFYPKDDTYGCIVESSQFRDSYEVFQTSGSEVIGISSDTPQSHAAFAEKYQLPFRLLSDQKQTVRDLYGVPSTLGMIPGRVTYIIDKEGVVRHIFDSQFHPKSHVDEALAIIRQQGAH